MDSKINKITTIMKRSFFRLCLLFMALTMLASMAEAKKIKYGNYITYDGKVENDLPKGEGKLIIVNNAPGIKKPAIVEGTFDGWTVGNILPASVYFYSREYQPFFRGKTEIQIAEDGSSVSFRLISGDFYDRAEGIQFEGIKNYNVVMTCTPKEDGIYLSSTPFRIMFKIKDSSQSKYGEKYKGRLSGKSEWRTHDANNNNVFVWGFSDSEWYSYCTCQYEGKNDVTKSDYYEEIIPKHSNIKKYVMKEKTLTEITEAGTFVYDEFHVTGSVHGDEFLSFSKKLEEGTLDYNNGSVTLTDKQGNHHTVLYYDFHNKTIKNFEHFHILDASRSSLSRLGMRIMEGSAYTAARKLADNCDDTKAMFELGIALVKGDGVKANEEEGNAWIQKAARNGGQEAQAYLAEQKANADAELLKLAANYGAHQDAGGMFFAEEMKELEAGTESANVSIGLCYQFGYGIDKNMTKAFEYYKKASAASDEAVKACGEFLMGLCYWKGEGTAKNQVQAYKMWTNYTNYSKSNWGDFNDWCGRWSNEELKRLVKPKELMAYKHYYHAQCYEQGIGTQKYLEEAIGFYAAAVQWKDIADAWYKLGYYAERGKYGTILNGIPDRRFARQCYQKAAQLGSNQAKQALNRM